MKDHMKLSMREKTNHVILHIGVNDLDNNRSSNLIAKSITGLAKTIKSKS